MHDPRLLSFGEAIANNADGTLPNVDATLRKYTKLSKGLIVSKVFGDKGVFVGKIVKIDKVNSTLYPGTERMGYQVIISYHIVVYRTIYSIYRDYTI